MENLRRKLDKAEDEIQYHISRKEELKDEIEDLKNKIDFLDEKIEDIEANCRSLASEHKRMKETVDRVNKELAAAKLEKSRALEKVGVVEKENSYLKKDLIETRNSNIQKVSYLNEKYDELEAKYTEALTCDMCEEVLGSSKDLQRHIKAYHKQNARIARENKCRLCGRAFITKEDLQRHTAAKHKTNNTMSKLLKKQNLLQLKIDKQKNDILDKTFKIKQREILENSVCHCKGICRINHSKHRWTKSKASVFVTKMTAVLWKFNCIACDFEAMCQNDLNSHIEKNHVEASYKCNLCDFESSSCHNLNSHKEKKHKEVKPLKSILKNKIG